MVAAFVYTILNNYPLDEAAKWAAAAGTVTATKPGTEVCTLEEVLEFIPKVQVEKL
jgi:1-phosphofructokinase